MRFNNIFAQNLYYSLPAESRRRLSMASTKYRDAHNTNTQRNRVKVVQLMGEVAQLKNAIKDRQRDLNGLKRGNNWSIFKRYEGIDESERGYYTKTRNGKQEMKNEVDMIKRNAEISETIENDEENLMKLKMEYMKKRNSAIGLYNRLQRVDPTFIVANPRQSVATANKKKSGGKGGKGSSKGGKGGKGSSKGGKGGKGSSKGGKGSSTKGKGRGSYSSRF